MKQTWETMFKTVYFHNKGIPNTPQHRINCVWNLRVWGQFLANISEPGKCHKLCTHILIDISVVDWNVHFPSHREAFIFMMLRARVDMSRNS